MRSWLFCAATLTAALSAGCGGSAVYPVKGKVLYDGKPMKGGGSISMSPTKSQPGKVAGGVIQEDGTYELTTNTPGDGSMPGEFRVVIHQTVEREPEATQDGEKVGKSVVLVPPADRIPAIYSDPFKSPLILKVEAKDNQVDLDLKRDAGNGGPLPGQAFRPQRRGDDVARTDREPFGPFRTFGRGGSVR